MRYRITVRGDDMELRGYLDGDNGDVLNKINHLAGSVKPLGAVVIASLASTDYDPFEAWEQRE